jgi:hypothetical protein
MEKRIEDLLQDAAAHRRNFDYHRRGMVRSRELAERLEREASQMIRLAHDGGVAEPGDVVTVETEYGAGVAYQLRYFPEADRRSRHRLIYLGIVLSPEECSSPRPGEDLPPITPEPAEAAEES